ncbi:MAG: ABC transporter ATP-binding protein [Elusimicrobiales bacterium]|nr:ABC transporter ATP-binding protein [Elusimicrobiales bacterium]
MNISLKSLKKDFTSARGKFTVLDSVDLEIKEGEFFVLLGPSGCGKSTLLNLLAGLEKPSSGEISFGGTLMAGPGKFTGPRGRNVAMVFQSYALYPHLTVFGNIAFPLNIAKVPKPEIKERVEKAAAMLGITALLGSKPGELSGGERQRVAIARAVVRRPDVLLFDEPLSNLDAQLRLATRVELKKLQRELGITSIYVTHDQVEAMTLGDRVAVLKDGKLQQLDTPMGLYERPANRFVAQFIGFPPMNLMDCTLTEEAGAMAAGIGGVRLVPLKKPGLKTGPASIGIRPSDIEVSREPVPGSVPVRIDLAEPLGRDILLSFSLAGTEVSALTGDAGLTEGREAHARLIPEKVHVFI